jgi:hypothetical protein
MELEHICLGGHYEVARFSDLANKVHRTWGQFTMYAMKQECLTNITKQNIVKNEKNSHEHGNIRSIHKWELYCYKVALHAL